jgi:hypothetical protein
MPTKGREAREMTIESTSGGDPEDPDGAEGQRSVEAGDININSDLIGVRHPRAAGDDLYAEILRGDNSVTTNSPAVGRSSGRASVDTDVESDPTEDRRTHNVDDHVGADDHDGPLETDGGRLGNDGIALTTEPNPDDISLTGNRIGPVHGRPIARRPRVPLLRQLRILGDPGFR